MQVAFTWSLHRSQGLRKSNTNLRVPLCHPTNESISCITQAISTHAVAGDFWVNVETAHSSRPETAGQTVLVIRPAGGIRGKTAPQASANTQQIYLDSAKQLGQYITRSSQSF
jgi:hypothetical protein